MRPLLLALLLLLAGCARPAAPVTQGQRIVSLTPSVTELVYAIGAGSRVVGVTRNDSYPPEVKSLPQVGDIHIDYEAVLALKPDLVVYDAGFSAEAGKRLRELGLPVLEVRSASLDGLHQALATLGERLHCEAQAERVVGELDARLAAVRQRAAGLARHPRVFVEIERQPNLMTAANGTFVDDLVSLAGGENAYRDRQGYATVSTESLLLKNPDVIVLTTTEPAEAARLPGWSGLKAVKEGRVHRMDPSLLVRPTPRNAEAVEQLQSWL